MQFANGGSYGSPGQPSQEFPNLDALAPGPAHDQPPEVVWAPGKSADQIATMLMSLTERQRVAVAARVDPDMYAAVRHHAPGVEYNARAHTLKLRSSNADQLPKTPRLPGSVAIVTADTADQAVAAEASVLADYLGAYTFRISDVGASRIHALLSNVDSLRAADVVVVVSGTDCSLPTLVAGLTQAPVVAVPTSSGFGASLGGVAPLLATLASNVPGVTLVNIDNGYAAASTAVRMLRMAARLHRVRSAAEQQAAAAALAAQQPNGTSSTQRRSSSN